MALDPNVHIQEVKALTCDIRPGRRPHGLRLASFAEAKREHAVESTTAPDEPEKSRKT
jgi:formate dehydrogenase major subunit